MIWTILLFGHKLTAKKVLVFENKALRRILGISCWDRVSNTRIREISKF